MQKVNVFIKETLKHDEHHIFKISCAAIVIIIGITLYQICKPITLEDTDMIPIQTMVDTQEGVINQEGDFILPDRVETSTEYTLTVKYTIIDKESDGKTIFTLDGEPSDDYAYVAGRVLETSVTHYPSKKRVSAHLNMISSVTPITNQKGESIDITKQQLVPVFEMTKVTE